MQRHGKYRPNHKAIGHASGFQKSGYNRRAAKGRGGTGATPDHHREETTTLADENPANIIDFLRGRFARLNDRLDTIKRKADEIITRVSSLEYRFAGFERELAAVNQRLDNLDRRATRIERRLDLIEEPTPNAGG